MILISRHFVFFLDEFRIHLYITALKDLLMGEGAVITFAMTMNVASKTESDEF